MFPRGVIEPTVLLENSTNWFMWRMIRNFHVVDKMFDFVKLSEACCTFMPAN